ncbi:MAG: hypothetical protein M1337_06685 [Actinobacteria bacterium]|nr:hypothetical protein [Actinomycetota bacterium]
MNEWGRLFQNRMRLFESRRPPGEGEIALSIKERVTSGCFHHEHSPHAYGEIDGYRSTLGDEALSFQFEEHESGPEILVFVSRSASDRSIAAVGRPSRPMAPPSSQVTMKFAKETLLSHELTIQDTSASPSD